MIKADMGRSQGDVPTVDEQSKSGMNSHRMAEWLTANFANYMTEALAAKILHRPDVQMAIAQAAERLAPSVIKAIQAMGSEDVVRVVAAMEVPDDK